MRPFTMLLTHCAITATLLTLTLPALAQSHTASPEKHADFSFLANTNARQRGAAARTQASSVCTIRRQETATVIAGVNTAVACRTNDLAKMEELLHIIANGMEILGIFWGVPTMIMGFMYITAGYPAGMKRVLLGAHGLTAALSLAEICNCFALYACRPDCGPGSCPYG